MGKNQHVVPVYDLWGIKGEGNQKYTGLYDTQAEVIACALTRFPETSVLSFSFTEEMVEFVRETHTVTIHPT